MKANDILNAVGGVSPELIDKTALPADTELRITKHSGGRKHIEGLRPNRFMAAAVACLLLVGNVGLIAFFARMNRPDTDSSMVAAEVTGTETTALTTAPDESSESASTFISVPAFPAMPNFVGMNFDLALATAEEMGLAMEKHLVASTEVPAGCIVSQTPEVGADVVPGSVIVVEVSAGYGTAITVPDVVGMDYEAAMEMLKELGVYVDKRLSYNDEVPEGCVISQEPEAGSELAAGSYVVAYVSLGANKETVSMPNVVDMTDKNAKWIIEQLGLTVAINWVDSDVPEGTVLAQNIPAGEEIAAGTTVTLDVSNGQDIVFPPYETSDVVVSIEEGTLTPTGCKVVINNYIGESIYIGYEFHITQNGQELREKTGVSFIAIALEVQAGVPYEMTYDWKDRYGELAPGTYRLYIDCHLDGEQKYVDFTIA